MACLKSKTCIRRTELLVVGVDKLGIGPLYATLLKPSVVVESVSAKAGAGCYITTLGVFVPLTIEKSIHNITTYEFMSEKEEIIWLLTLCLYRYSFVRLI